MPEKNITDLLDEYGELADSFNGQIDDVARALAPQPELKHVRSEYKSWMKEVGADLTRVVTMLEQAGAAFHVAPEPAEEVAEEPEAPKSTAKKTTRKSPAKKGGSKGGKKAAAKKAAVPA